MYLSLSAFESNGVPLSLFKSTRLSEFWGLFARDKNIFSLLTLIRAAGGVYDFRNFEEVYLCNGLSSNLQSSCVPQKRSREYILLNTLEQKTAFFASYRPKRVRNPP